VRIHPDLTDLSAELAELRARVDELTNESDSAPSVTRRRMLTALAGLGAVGAATMVPATPAAAADGDSVVLGQPNTATTATSIATTSDGESSQVTLGGSGWGIFATSDSTAILGATHSGGVFGVNGVAVDSGVGVAGHAEAAGAIGVVALSKAGPAMAALSQDDGVTLELTPADRAGPPTSVAAGLTEYRTGSISIDDDGELWLCVTTGDPGTWTRVLREDTATGRTVPITPIRAIDTRVTGGRPTGSPAVPGQKKGPLLGGTSITLDLAGIGPIPGTAAGVVGNLTVASPTYTGYLTARPSGTPGTTSSLNFPKGVTAIANAFTSQLGPAGLTITGSGTNTNSYHLIVDITAYIT
jgi:hypothetical protein